MAWLDIQTAIKQILTDNDYTVYNNNVISRTVDTYVVVISQPERNLDEKNYVGVNQYRNIREFTLWVYNKKPLGIVDLDLVKQASRDAYEPILQDFKKLFNSCYNAIGDAGGILLRYLGMNFVDVPTEGIYAPVRMEVKFSVQFIEDRHVN